MKSITKANSNSNNNNNIKAINNNNNSRLLDSPLILLFSFLVKETIVNLMNYISITL
jgi:hypothetical protein